MCDLVFEVKKAALGRFASKNLILKRGNHQSHAGVSPQREWERFECVFQSVGRHQVGIQHDVVGGGHARNGEVAHCIARIISGLIHVGEELDGGWEAQCFM